MIKGFKIIVLFSVMLLFTGCATIMGGATAQGVSIKTNPAEASVTIKDINEGTVVSKIKSPQVVMLPRSAAFFQSAKYALTVEKDGYDKREVKIEPDMSGWYTLGNLVVGGLVGWLLIDPATGAMWSFHPDQVNILLNPAGQDPYGFNAAEFKPPFSIEKICEAIRADKYELVEFTAPDNTVSRLNEMLEIMDFDSKLSFRNKFPKKNGEPVYPADITAMIKEKNLFTDNIPKFIGLNFDQQIKLKTLNRRLMELAYPNETPKKAEAALDKKVAVK